MQFRKEYALYKKGATTMSGTTLIPGWWVKFLSAVTEQLPRAGNQFGEIDQTTAEGWSKNQAALKKALAETLLPPEPAKFGLFVDLGIITVPDDYVHNTRLASFSKQNRKKFYYYNDDITDAHFAKATVQLMPGRKLHVKVFKQIVSGTTTSEERMAFLKTQNAVLVGAQGASLVFEQKREDLPKGFWYSSFDKKEALWEDADGDRRVPSVYRDSDGGWSFDLGCFEGVWRDGSCLLCFCDCD